SWLNPSTLIQEQAEAKPLQAYRKWHGPRLNRPDYGPWSHALAWSLHTATGDVVLWCGLNAFHESIQFDLPRCRNGWRRYVDTALPAGDDLPGSSSPWSRDRVLLESHSLVLMVAGRHCPAVLEADPG
ncbi:MAG: glycogen-debranching protein, partial [Cyanobacteria bacterium MAG APA_bin_95]|nr:glycogen-debranching protein [Cyanobacteria bacterium MAG APA_bin_95]